jgi:hypothetical protein
MARKKLQDITSGILTLFAEKKGAYFFFVLPALFLVFLILINVYSFFYSVEFDTVSYDVTDLSPLVKGYLYRVVELKRWFVLYGTKAEFSVFSKIADLLLESSKTIAPASLQTQVNTLTRINFALHFSLLHIFFLLFACARFWLCCILGIFCYEYINFKNYLGRDILGQFSNGRLFFSGINLNFDKLNSHNLPEVQSIGFACPGLVPAHEAYHSMLHRILVKYNALNTTNFDLIRILLAYRSIPSYIIKPEIEELETDNLKFLSLEYDTICVLEAVLLIHSIYKQNAHKSLFDIENQIKSVVESYTNLQHENLQDNQFLISEIKKELPEKYFEKICYVLNALLCKKMKIAFAEFDASLLATTILAMESGKALAFSYEGGRWVRKTSFLELSARAVLFSLPSFGSDYDYDAREVIRQSIVFSSRYSIFAPVSLPQTVPYKTLSLRQITEFMLYNLSIHSYEINYLEFFGMLRDFKFDVIRYFKEKRILDSDVASQSLLADVHGILYMPLELLLQTFSEILPPGDQEALYKKIEYLSDAINSETGAGHLKHSTAINKSNSTINKNLNVANLVQHSEGREQMKDSLSVYIPRVFSEEEKHQLREGYLMSDEQIMLWTVVNSLLESFNWITKRILNRSVPGSNVISIVFKGENTPYSKNSLGLSSLRKIVPLRGVRMITDIGDLYNLPIPQTDFAYIADNQSEIDLLLSDKFDYQNLHSEGE